MQNFKILNALTPRKRLDFHEKNCALVLILRQNSYMKNLSFLTRIFSKTVWNKGNIFFKKTFSTEKPGTMF